MCVARTAVLQIAYQSTAYSLLITNYSVCHYQQTVHNGRG